MTDDKERKGTSSLASNAAARAEADKLRRQEKLRKMRAEAQLQQQLQQQDGKTLSYGANGSLPKQFVETDTNGETPDSALRRQQQQLTGRVAMSMNGQSSTSNRGILSINVINAEPDTKCQRCKEYWWSKILRCPWRCCRRTRRKQA
jgi:hypothetical protein